MFLKTPVLLIAFNRPEQTRRVFAEIRSIRPEKLFIAVDGPRIDRPDDIDKCRQVREIVTQIDWPCDVKKLFRDRNLGCKIGATTAIDWFFKEVEEGIILEDDCLPDPTFFPFCEEMLSHFRNDERISMISGHNVVGILQIPYSYTFSKFGHLWGWASWRRSWKNYDVTMKTWLDKENRKRIRRAIGDRRDWNYHEWQYENTFYGRKDTWDYQWESYRLLIGQIAVIPAYNMIENLGFGKDATHTKQPDSPLILSRRSTPFPLKHNPEIKVDQSYDQLLRPNFAVPSVHLRKIKNLLKSLLTIFLSGSDKKR